MQNYTFSYWDVDGANQGSGTNLITVIMSNPHAATAHYAHSTLPVGGIYIPVNKLSLLAPYIGLTILLTVTVSTVVYIKKRKRNTEINS